MDNNIYKTAVETFGEESQIKLAIEEMAELIKEISKYQRYGKSNIEEEIADVKIMIRQLEEIFDKKAIKGWEIIKLDRLKKLIDKSCS